MIARRELEARLRNERKNLRDAEARARKAKGAGEMRWHDQEMAHRQHIVGQIERALVALA